MPDYTDLPEVNDTKVGSDEPFGPPADAMPDYQPYNAFGGVEAGAGTTAYESEPPRWGEDAPAVSPQWAGLIEKAGTAAAGVVGSAVGGQGAAAGVGAAQSAQGAQPQSSPAQRPAQIPSGGGAGVAAVAVGVGVLALGGVVLATRRKKRRA